MNLNSETVTAIAGAFGVSAIIVALITAFSNRAKTGADATKVITEAALGVVSQLEKTIDALKAQINELEHREARRSIRENLANQAALKHQKWDNDLVALINDRFPNDPDIPAPPPLYFYEPDLEFFEQKKDSA